MAINDIVQTIAEARVDARSLSEFVFKPAGFKVTRRLAPTVDTLQFYINRFNTLDGDFKSSVSTAVSSLNNSVAEAEGKVAYIETTVQDAINNTAVEGGVLADTFVTATANGVGAIARTQRDKNSDTITVFDFGAISDGLYHPLSERYDTLAKAEAQYPFATSLTDSIDWCAAQAFLNACHANSFPSADMSINAVITKPLHHAGNDHKTLIITGDVKLHAIEGYPLEYFLKWEGAYSQMNGVIECFGYRSHPTDNLSKTCKNGVLLGIDNNDLVDGAIATGSYIEAVKGNGLSGYALVIGQNAHFAEVGYVYGGACGSCGAPDTQTNTTSAAWSNKVDTDLFALQGKSTIKVDKLPASNVSIIDSDAFTTNVFVTINGEIYAVESINRTDSTIAVQPCITTESITGTLDYIQGGAVYTVGNNSANTIIRRINAIVSGIGVRLTALYGSQILAHTTEYCGIGIALSSRSSLHIGTVISTTYFEANKFDIVNCWLQTLNGLVMHNTMGVVPEKVVSLYTYLVAGRKRLDEGSWNSAGIDLRIESKSYSAEWQETGTDVTDKETFKTFVTNSYGLIIGCNEHLYRLYGKDSIMYCFHSNSTPDGSLTDMAQLDAAAGHTINGGSRVTFMGADYDGPLLISVIRADANQLLARCLTPKKPVAPTP